MINADRLQPARITRRGSLGLAIGAIATPFVGTAARAAQGEAAWGGIDALMAKIVSGRLSPSVWLSVMQRGKMLHSAGAGYANLEIPTPVSRTSVYRIGSVTKQFTAAAVLLLAEAGKLSPDDKLSRFFPDFPRAGDISLRQMLSHTSGLGNYTNTASIDAFLQNARPDYDTAELLAAMRAPDPLFAFEPGTKWAYSNTGYVLLGLVIEKASGEGYAAVMSKLFDRAGLTHTAVDDAADVVPGRVSGYTPDPDAPGGFDNSSFISMSYAGAAGALRSTADDLCRWHDALLGGRVLRPASLEAMLTPARSHDGTLPMGLGGPQADPKRPPVRYGFGVGLGMEGEREVVSHTGGIQGFHAHLTTFREAGLTMALTVNCDGGLPPNGLAPALSELRKEAVKLALG